MHYTQRLKELRLSKNLKQYDIAKILNITRQQYTLYETGRRQITLDKLMLLAEFYQVSFDYILGYTDDSKTQWNLKKFK